MRTIYPLLVIALLILNIYQYFHPRQVTSTVTQTKYLPSQATVDTVYKPSITYKLLTKHQTDTIHHFVSRTDTVYPDIQVIHTTDSVYLSINPSQRQYHFSNSDVYISGVNPTLDSLFIHTKSFHHGPSISLNSIGYNFTYKQFSITPSISFKGKPNVSFTYFIK